MRIGRRAGPLKADRQARPQDPRIPPDARAFARDPSMAKPLQHFGSLNQDPLGGQAASFARITSVSNTHPDTTIPNAKQKTRNILLSP
jgi:hypothetical protein